ncbi:MAG: hypothetical protein M3R22_07355 [Pseudomonadota bacterium]|nr:hypothetical protein [Pseudomonadota bacterium]
MNISSASSSVASSLAAIQGLQPQQVTAAADTDGGSGVAKPHKMHGGGHMRQAVTQALQSLGLTPPASVGAAAATSSTSTSTDGSSGSSDSGSATSGIQQDMQRFMHSLFEAVKSESSTDTSASSATGDSKTSFADGLSTLISQVSSGSAPADLQGAFSKLASDLQAAGSTMSTAASTSGNAASGVQASLQAFLTNLQQDLGYGSLATSSVGNLVATQV